MNKLIFTVLILFAYGALAAPNPEAKADAKPGVLAAAPLVAAAPAVAPAFVTARSSQAILRTYSALASPYVAAPYVAAPAPLISSPYLTSYAAPYFAAPYLI
ncbi:cuticle protein 16.5-like [Coccinella septempunctata]|uniref:cuticle protein 16.5-like n=1 Tax=Coccinella septempunctata TaxID=41139 RepID=UPI001D08F0FA|nr:cuticle protein 16.5-like [Coccinella septempunctata]